MGAEGNGHYESQGAMSVATYWRTILNAVVNEGENVTVTDRDGNDVAVMMPYDRFVEWAARLEAKDG
jgi:hypothetical protein